MKLLAHDRHQHVDAYRDPHLSLDRVVARAEEMLDSQVLLDPLEEQFHLPSALVQLGNDALSLPNRSRAMQSEFEVTDITESTLWQALRHAS